MKASEATIWLPREKNTVARAGGGACGGWVSLARA